jgi:YVTN family beta-propeller protein
MVGSVASQDQKGQVSLFLSQSASFTFPSKVHLSDIYLHSGTEKIDLSLMSPVIDLKTVAREQVLLSHVFLDPGEYNDLSFSIEPDEVHDSVQSSARQLITIPITLTVHPGSADILFLQMSQQFDTDSLKRVEFTFKFIKKTNPPTSATGFVSLENSSNLFYFDRRTGDIIGSVAVGQSPRGMVTSHARGLLYVANSQGNSISVIDILTKRVIQTICLDSGDEPEKLTLSKDETWLFSANRGSSTVSVIDCRIMNQYKKINVGNAPADIATDPKTGQIFVVNNFSDDITIFYPESPTQAFYLPVGASPTSIDLDTQNGFAYVAASKSGKIVQIDLQRKVVTSNYPLNPSIECLLFDEFSANLYCSISGLNYISIFRPALNLEINQVQLTSVPHALTIDPERTSYYVACSDPNKIAVISRTSGDVTRYISTGLKPFMVLFP